MAYSLVVQQHRTHMFPDHHAIPARVYTFLVLFANRIGLSLSWTHDVSTFKMNRGYGVHCSLSPVSIERSMLTISAYGSGH